MTLSLDDVRNKRFRMARKSGYEVLEVDEFVDEVEETFGQLFEENQSLKKQIEALKSDAPAATPAAPEKPVVQQTPPPAPAPAPVEQTPPSAPAKPVVPGAVVVTTSQEASTAVVRLVQLSTEQAERLVQEASDEADRIREEANRTAHQVTTDARTRAERLESEARLKAEGLQADALNRSEELDREIKERRTQLVGDLEHERDALSNTVEALRRFEATYRTNLTTHLREQIRAVESGSLEPADPPPSSAPRPSVDGSDRGNGASQADASAEERDQDVTLGGGGPTSDTPRLDALLGDQR
jgi:DivIVA domain-containing protein